MACPNCDHTMQQIQGNITQGPGSHDYRVFWCPRCGTLKNIDGISKPMLVSRVVKFAGHFGEDDDTVVPMVYTIRLTFTGQR